MIGSRQCNGGPRSAVPFAWIAGVVRSGWLGVLGCVSVACGEAPSDGSAGPGVAVRDSAGIRVVENGRPAEGSRLGWRIGPEPAVSIGAQEGEEPYLLHWVSGATKLPDGRIVVANGGTNEVRVFDPAGQHLETWGGAGEGPGEFLGLSQIARWRGDSLVAWYSQGRSISVFDDSGTFGRSLTLRTAGAESWRQPRPLAPRPDGTFLSINDPEDEDTAVVEIWHADGTLAASLGSHPSLEVTVEMDASGNPELSLPAYGRELRVAPWGELVVISPTSRYEIRAFRADGSLARIVRREHAPRAPDQTDLARYVELHMTSFEEALPAAMLPELRSSLESTRLAETFPAFGSITSDAVGHLWVREYDYPREERPAPLWSVYDPEGRILGFVETPGNLTLYEIGEDYVLGSTRDDFDVEYVQLWPLDRSPEGSDPPPTG